jgi:hypothetical protein
MAAHSEPKLVELAYLEKLWPYTDSSANSSGVAELEDLGMIRLYEDKPTATFTVIQTSRIFGKVIAIPDPVTPTIPRGARNKARYYPNGKCDTSVGAGNGSRLYWVMMPLMKWGRSMGPLCPPQ